MRVQPYLPDSVRNSIQRHLSKAIKAVVESHVSGQEDEDTLTGHLGFAIRTRHPRGVVVENDGRRETWNWSLNYHKFRGRGKGATERIIGADGIVQFSIDAVEQHFTKSALFQAKAAKNNLQKLLSQCIMLSTWKEAAFVVQYGRERYTASALDDAMKQALRLPHHEGLALDAFFMDVFVACMIGDSDLLYEPSDRVLRWRDHEGKIVHSSFAVRHMMQLQVKGPNQSAWQRGEEISVADIHEHRLNATDEEILGVSRTATEAEIKRARREAAKLYHADKHQQLEPGVQHILNLRMKEQNAAADRVLVRLKRDGNA
jgi:hypothetical protein